MKKVLVVDDTKNIRNLLATCLELNDYTVFSAKNGAEAIELIEKESFDLAFMDVKMPELSGTEVLRRLRAMGHTYPVIIMTAYATVKNAIECTNLGAIAYLQKPFKVDKVNEIINMVKTLKVNDNDINALIEQSRKLLQNNDVKEALKLLKKGLSIDPSKGEIYYLIGKIHESINEMVEANKYYSTAELFDYK
jgi:two-component system, OmpR family, response regulator